MHTNKNPMKTSERENKYFGFVFSKEKDTEKETFPPIQHIQSKSNIIQEYLPIQPTNKVLQRIFLMHNRFCLWNQNQVFVFPSKCKLIKPFLIKEKHGEREREGGYNVKTTYEWAWRLLHRDPKIPERWEQEMIDQSKPKQSLCMYVECLCVLVGILSLG